MLQKWAYLRKDKNMKRWKDIVFGLTDDDL